MDARNIGLRNIEVADTKISSIDGEHGKLIYRGYDILDLVNRSTFEETAYLLIFGDLPNQIQLTEFSDKLRYSRNIPESLLLDLHNRPKTAFPMDILQSSVSYLSNYDDDLHSDGKTDNIQRASILIAKIPSIIAAWNRIRNGMEYIEPTTDLSHSANFLYMLFGRKPQTEEIKVFDICLILHAEHSFNASTFAAREIASTRAHMYACICGALGALSGELHGGANIQVMKMLLDINDPENVDEWINETIKQGKRIMGMGHAVYHTTDPRAEILERLSKSMSRGKNSKYT